MLVRLNYLLGDPKYGTNCEEMAFYVLEIFEQFSFRSLKTMECLAQIEGMEYCIKI